MAQRHATIVLTVAWEEGATLGPDYGDAPVTAQEVAEYLVGADWALVPGVTVRAATVAPEGNFAL